MNHEQGCVPMEEKKTLLTNQTSRERMLPLFMTNSEWERWERCSSSAATTMISFIHDSKGYVRNAWVKKIQVSDELKLVKADIKFAIKLPCFSQRSAPRHLLWTNKPTCIKGEKKRWLPSHFPSQELLFPVVLTPGMGTRIDGGKSPASTQK